MAMKYDDLVIDGEAQFEEKKRTRSKGRRFVAGLRLLRLYGKMADRMLKAVESGKDVCGLAPFVESVQYRDCIMIAASGVHRTPSVPTLPDYSTLSLKVTRVDPTIQQRGLMSKKELRDISRGYTIDLASSCLGVFPGGHVREMPGDNRIGSLWVIKRGLSWSFRDVDNVKNSASAVRSALARALSKVLIQNKVDQAGKVAKSQAEYVHKTLRDRCQARLELDGHAERIRNEIIAAVAVDNVHKL